MSLGRHRETVEGGGLAVLLSTGLRRVRHHLATEEQQQLMDKTSAANVHRKKAKNIKTQIVGRFF